ncbi:MAG: hypothetical protein ABI026_07675 [Gemmatimonadaceae bacterium]
MTRRFVSSLLKAAGMTAVPVAMLAVSAPLSAQRGGERMLFEWRGRVDQEIRIQMHGGRTAIVAMGPREVVGYDNARALSSVPDMNGYVSVRMMEGRGVADVVEQPNRGNGYTTVVRVRDRQSGLGQYDIAAYWQPDGNSHYDDRGVYSGVYNDGRYDNDGYYDDRYDNRRYDVNGRYDRNGGYDAYGRYAPYPPVVVVQRPVYVNQGIGKTLPAPQRSNGYPPSRAYPRYPAPGASVGYPATRYPSGKTLPGAVRAKPRVAPPVVHPAPSGSAGKTLPGTGRPGYQGDAKHRG